jgi:NAD(P)-dependent dehydrogenase (short-subunit alcohol dehydrogenase family)
MPNADLTLPGETALVAGAGAGIGREITELLTATGIDAAINDIDK